MLYSSVQPCSHPACAVLVHTNAAGSRLRVVVTVAMTLVIVVAIVAAVAMAVAIAMAEVDVSVAVSGLVSMVSAVPFAAVGVAVPAAVDVVFGH